MNPKKYPTLSRVTQLVSGSRDQQMNHYLTAQEAAVYLRKSSGAIHNMVYRRQLTAYKPGGRLLFRKEEIDQWVLKNRLIVGYGN